MSQKASGKDQKNTQTLFISAFKHLERKHKMNKSLMVKREKSQENLQSTSHSCPIIIDFTGEYCVIIHPKMISVCVRVLLLLNLTAIFFPADAYICG